MRIKLKKESVTVSVPNRIHMFTSRSHFNVNGETGGAGISIDVNNQMRIKVSNTMHADSLVLCNFSDVFKKIVGYDGFFDIEYDRKEIFPIHSGYGTTISMIVAFCYAVNYMFGSNLTTKQIRTIIMENYCEQQGNSLVRGLDTGVGTACSLYGGMNLITNNSSIVHLDPSDDVIVLSFVPYNYDYKTISLDDEINDQIQSFNNDEETLDKRMSLVYNSFIPALLMEKWEQMGDVVEKIHTMGVKKMECTRYDYHYQLQLIQNLRQYGALVAGLSSLGPMNYCIVWKKDEDYIKKMLLNNGITNEIKVHRICHKGIEVVNELS